MMMFLLSSPAYPVGVRYGCGYEYKSRIADDSTLLLSGSRGTFYLLHTLAL